MDIDYKIIYPIGATLAFTALAALGIYGWQSRVGQDPDSHFSSAQSLNQNVRAGGSVFTPYEQSLFALQQQHTDGLLSGSIGIDELFAFFPQTSIDADDAGFSMTPKIHLEDKDDSYEVLVDIPSGQSVDVNAALSGNQLTIQGSVSSAYGNGSDAIASSAPSIRSFQSSRFSQTVTLAQSVDESGLRVEQSDDQIKVTVPKLSS